MPKPIRSMTPLGTRVDLATNKRIDQLAKNAGAAAKAPSQTIIAQLKPGQATITPAQMQQIIDAVIAALGGALDVAVACDSFSVATYGNGPYPLKGIPLGACWAVADSVPVPQSFLTLVSGVANILTSFATLATIGYANVDIYYLKAV